MTPIARVLKHNEYTLDRNLGIFISRTAPDYIVEVGCYDGQALKAFGENSPYSKLVGFEANPTNFFRSCLGKNIQNLAVSNKIGTIKFHEPHHDERSPSRVSKKRGGIFKIKDTESYTEYEVLCTTLDFFFQHEIENNKTFVLIVDAEGATREILEGARKFLKNTIALKIEVEREEIFRGQKLENSCLDLLRDKILIGEQILTNTSEKKLRQTNYYFVSDVKNIMEFSGY
jgi:FkbM family methyltransferase